MRVAIIVHQESVCATFGSGLSSACVVDVGDQKTSLSCVEDGVSHRNSRSDWVTYGYKLFSSYRFICRLWSKFTFLIHNCDLLCMVAADCWCVNRDGNNVFITVSRVCLGYGGSDVTRTFFWLLQRAGFPYRECQLNNRLDCQLLQQLKETLCHLEQVCIGQGVGSDWKKCRWSRISAALVLSSKNQLRCVMRWMLFPQDISGLQDHEFQTRFPDAPALLYQVRLGDEKIQVPSSQKLACLVKFFSVLLDPFCMPLILDPFCMPLIFNVFTYIRHQWVFSTRPHLAL